MKRPDGTRARWLRSYFRHIVICLIFPKTLSYGSLVVGAAVILLAGMVIGLVVGRTMVPDGTGEVTVAETGSRDDSGWSADPSATETSPHTVIEDEPFGPALPAIAPTQPSAPPPAASGHPAWEKYALPDVRTGGRPMIAVIIDDMGLDKRRSEKILQLSGPLTVSFMSYAEDLPRQTGEAKARGHELMMHVPMEPVAEGMDPGPGALLVNLSPEETRKRIVDDLDRFHGYVGINNHMGSKFTAYAPGMQLVMDELRQRGLLFVDSLTTDHSVGLALAQKDGIPAAARNVFLDNAGDLPSVQGQLGKLEEMARKKGTAVAIGHPRDATIAALTAWLPTLAGKGLVLVPVTEVVRTRRMVASGTH
ncbi:divergent polysaccharide deacetylase family protein [Telmatospirillum sp.]|uniref:divergent polysaccharide deacetylase family protein n=1 Tax=Telmatospirillum sp. TaxID=2079197 RepID=UPI002840A363|nr:divergent polysaccharide deacetylase family protein [Telmatospirillum sp.]MDR3441006.1 divergent polysaccharide deacetylase family protein [Telmatospirillum sp.]